MDNAAITPEILPGPMTEAPVDATQGAVEDHDKEVGALVHHPGWAHFEAAVGERITAFLTLRDVDLSDLALEDIGRRFVVAREVAAELEGFLTWVRATATHVDAHGRDPE